MLASAHKDLLLKLARSHALELQASLSTARLVLGDAHPNVGKLREEIRLTVDAVRTLHTAPERAAA